VDVALVYPQDAAGSTGTLRVCSGIGAAILGLQGGHAIDRRIPDRTRRIWFEKVLYQPEAAGDFHLWLATPSHRHLSGTTALLGFSFFQSDYCINRLKSNKSARSIDANTDIYLSYFFSKPSL